MKVALDDMGACHTPWTWGEVRSLLTLLNGSELRRGQGAPKKTSRTMEERRLASPPLGGGGRGLSPPSGGDEQEGEEYSSPPPSVKKTSVKFYIREFIE